jgi:hypothetical protein
MQISIGMRFYLEPHGVTSEDWRTCAMRQTVLGKRMDKYMMVEKYPYIYGRYLWRIGG